MARRMVVGLEGLDDVARALQRRGMDVQAGLEQICHAGAQMVLDDARARAPDYVSENLDKQTTARRATKVEVSVGPTREKHIAGFTEYGTKAHEIGAKQRKRRARKALAIPGWGIYKRVRHPGSRKQPFLRPAYFSQRQNAQTAMQVQTKRVLRA